MNLMNKDIWLGIGTIAFGVFLLVFAIPSFVSSPSNVPALVLAPTFWPTIVAYIIVVLGAALDPGGVGLVAAVTTDTELLAGALIEDAKKTVGGGGKPADDLAVAGGKDAGALDEALDQARTAAGIA